MTRWLIPQWFDQVRSMGADLPGLSGVTATVRFEVTGGPDGDVSCTWGLADGRISPGVGDTTGAGNRTVDREGAPEVVLTMEREVAASMLRGELDPNVAFMQGRMKVAGSMELMMALLPASRTAECGDFLAGIAAVTEF